jgi:hypothetical protein
MNHRDGEKCVEAGRETLPSDDQSAVLALEPRKRPLSLESRDGLSYGAPTWLSVFPHPFGNLGADTPFTKAMAKLFGVIAFIRHQHLEPFMRSAPFTCADVESIEQRDDLVPFVTIRGGRARG